MARFDSKRQVTRWADKSSSAACGLLQAPNLQVRAYASSEGWMRNLGIRCSPRKTHTKRVRSVGMFSASCAMPQVSSIQNHRPAWIRPATKLSGLQLCYFFVQRACRGSQRGAAERARGPHSSTPQESPLDVPYSLTPVSCSLNVVK